MGEKNRGLSGHHKRNPQYSGNRRRIEKLIRSSQNSSKKENQRS
jgi:hypothetical protein